MNSVTNLAKILNKKHEGKWVALSQDYKKVLSFNESLVVLNKKIGDEKVVYMKVPRADVYLSF